MPTVELQAGTIEYQDTGGGRGDGVPPGRPTSFVVWATTRIDRTEFGLTR
jgi:hypothetical protein